MKQTLNPKSRYVGVSLASKEGTLHLPFFDFCQSIQIIQSNIKYEVQNMYPASSFDGYEIAFFIVFNLAFFFHNFRGQILLPKKYLGI